MNKITNICFLIATTFISGALLAADDGTGGVAIQPSPLTPTVTQPNAPVTTTITTTVAPAATMQPAAPAQTMSKSVSPMPQSDNPTADFFIGLSQCQGGVYKELNLLNDSVGSQWLDQQIIGLDDQGYCQVILSTPDGRSLHCYFDPYDIAPLGDQHFLTGMIMAETNKQSKEAIYAEKQWSAIKDTNCGFNN